LRLRGSYRSWQSLAGLPTKAGTANCDTGARFLSGDGRLDLVTMQPTYSADDRYIGRRVQALTAYDLGGARLWQIGTPDPRVTDNGTDIPAEIYDLDTDGDNDVLAVMSGEFRVFDDATGTLQRSFPLPHPAHQPRLPGHGHGARRRPALGEGPQWTRGRTRPLHRPGPLRAGDGPPRRRRSRPDPGGHPLTPSRVDLAVVHGSNLLNTPVKACTTARSTQKGGSGGAAYREHRARAVTVQVCWMMLKRGSRSSGGRCGRGGTTPARSPR
jgi:hypothetical protein